MGYLSKDDGKKWRNSENRPKAKCHPDRNHRARGFCDRCYDVWLYANNEEFRKGRNEGAKKWREKNPDKKKKNDNNARLLRRYGITEAKYFEMVAIQNGKCKICDKPNIGEKGLHVDHCHTTGKVRGLLCLRCNGSLAWVEMVINKKKTEWFKSALKYLKDGK